MTERPVGGGVSYEIQGETMPIPDVEQPNILPIDDALRLRKFDDHFDFAFDWYQDAETVWLVDG